MNTAWGSIRNDLLFTAWAHNSGTSFHTVVPLAVGKVTAYAESRK